MKYKKLLSRIFFIILCFCYVVLPIYALHSSPSFKVGDSSLPMDEEGFIEYDFESSVASALSKIEVKVVDIYQLVVNYPYIVVNISVSQLNPNNSKYEALFVDSVTFSNQTCLSYNKSMQYFQYHQYMQNLLMNGYGGFFIIPNDPVNFDIVKGYIDTYTSWSANVDYNRISIGINNDQAILTYSEQGILIKQELISGGQTKFTLSIIEKGNPSISFGFFFLIPLITSIFGILMIYEKKRSIGKELCI